MPKDTFFHLPEEKQNKIIDAAMEEFSSVSFEKASINRIIKSAGISRGSFYMYFEDIYDLTLFLMHKTKKEVMQKVRSKYQTLPKQLDKLILAYHDVIFDYYNELTYRNLFKNVISYFQGRPEEEIQSMKGRFPIDGEFDILIPMLDASQFEQTDPTYMKDVIELSLIIFRNAMFKTFMMNLNKQESQQLLEKMLQILKEGYGGKHNA
jgi:AcrR family transcriptional regulator